MSSARQQLVALIQGFLTAQAVDPMPKVIGFARGADITQPTVMVMPEEIIPTPSSPRGNRTYTFSVLAIADTTVPTELGEAGLDDLVADILDALDSVGQENNVTWSTAKRATYEDKAPAYVITATTPLTNA